jgi:hypothetical protein
MGRRGKRFKKKKFNFYKSAIIIICLALIIASLYLVFKYKDELKLKFNDIFNRGNVSSTNDKNNTVDGVEIVPNDNNEISEEDAKNIAIRQFANLGEGANPNKLNVIRLQRNGEEFFYVSSPKNTVEIRISDGKITKINSVVVEE